MVRPSLRAHLQSETRKVHEHLHQAPPFAALAAGEITPDDLSALLARMGGFYLALDAVMSRALERFGTELSGYRYRPRACLFQSQSQTTFSVNVPETVASFAGIAYVVDGSVLGGQILARNLPTAESHPYFDMCRREGPAIWRQTLDLLASIENTVSSRAEAVRAAQETFTVFGRQVVPVMEDVK